MVRNQYPHFKAEANFGEKLDTIRKEAHTTYNVNYHFVWIPKYRKKILHGKNFKAILTDIIKGKIEDLEGKTLAFEIQPDHIHLFASIPPKHSASWVAKMVKGNSSIQMRRMFPILKAELGGSLWADGFYVSTAGYISEEKVKRYIETQMQRVHQHEYQERFGGKQLSLSLPPQTKVRGFREAV